jgi:hypothetical protein
MRVAGTVGSGGTTTFLPAACEKSKQRVVAEGVHECGVLLVRALPVRLPERREAAKVASGGAPAALPHQILQMSGVEVHEGLPLQPEFLIRVNQFESLV